MAESVNEKESLEILPENIGEDGFVTIWNLASDSTGGDVARTRALAAKILLFLCKKDYDYVVTSSTNMEYLDERQERESRLLNDWKPESESVDIIAQHAEVPAQGILKFLEHEKFSSVVNYTATRAQRLKWFKEKWCVG